MVHIGKSYLPKESDARLPTLLLFRKHARDIDKTLKRDITSRTLHVLTERLHTQYAIPRQPATYSTSQHCSHVQPQGRKGHGKRCRQGTAIRGPRIRTARYGKRRGPQIKRVVPNRRGCSKIR